VELSHRIEPFGWLSFQARERFEQSMAERQHDFRQSCRSTAGIDAGAVPQRRTHGWPAGVAWSQSAGDGLFLASDAPALDQIPSRATIHSCCQRSPLHRSRSGNGDSRRPRSECRALALQAVDIQGERTAEQPARARRYVHESLWWNGRADVELQRSDHRLPAVHRRLPQAQLSRHHATLDVDSDKLLGVDGRLGSRFSAG